MANKNIDFIIRTVDENLVRTLGMQIKEGKSFSDSLGSNNSYLLLNETAVKVMGLKHPVGTKVKLWGRRKNHTWRDEGFSYSFCSSANFPVDIQM